MHEQNDTPEAVTVDETVQVEEPKAPTYFDPFTVVVDGQSENLPLNGLNEDLTEKVLREKEKELEANDNINQSDAERIVSSIRDALQHSLPQDVYSRLFSEQERDWSQRAELDGKTLAISTYKAKLLPTGRLAGKAALTLVNSILGTGLETRIPLVSSGISVIVSGIREIEVHALIARLANTRRELGMSPGRSMFSAYDVHLVDTIVDWVLDHVTACTVKGASKEMLQNLICVSDIHALLAGALGSMYPNGYPFSHTCVNVATGKCNYSANLIHDPETKKIKHQSLINFNKTLWMDRSRLSNEDIRLLLADWGTVTVDDVHRYQERHRPDAISVPLNETGDYKYQIIMRHPSLRTYKTFGEKWISSVEELTNEILNASDGKDTDGRRRKAVMERAARILRVRENVAWIAGIQIDKGEDGVYDITDAEDVEVALGSNSDLKTIENMEKAILRYKEDCAIGVVGIPNFECPSCKSGQQPVGAKYAAVIPVSPVSYFFTIGEWRLFLAEGQV